MFEHKGVRRRVVVVAFYACVGLAVGILAAALIPQAAVEIEELQTHWPEKAAGLKKMSDNALDYALKRWPAAREVVPMIEEKAQAFAAHTAESLPNVASGLLGFFSLLFLVPFIAFFFLSDGPHILEKVLAACPGRHVEKALHVFCAISESIGNYLRAIFIEASIIGALATVGLYVLGMDYALTLGVLTGISGLIPYIGPIIVGALAAALTAIQFESLGPALNVILLFAGLRFFDDWFIQPYIMARAVHLHPALLIFALMFGGHFFGLLGLILAAPAACVLRVVFGALVEWYLTESGLKKSPSIIHEEIVIV